MKRMLHTLCALAISLGAYSQIVIDAADLTTNIGFEFERGATQGGNPGASGENQTWNFSNLSLDFLADTEILEPGTTPFDNFYPDANYIFSQNNGVAFEYYGLSETELTFYGQFEETAMELVFSDPQQLLEFPAQFGNSSSDDYSGTIAAPNASGTISGTVTNEVDATGTLEMSWGTVQNCLRIRTDIDQEEIITTPNAEVINELTGSVYTWYAEGFPGPIVVVRNLQVSTNMQPPITVSSTQYIFDIEVVGTNDLTLANDLNVYPNPATDWLNVSFTSRVSTPLIAELLDVQGRVVSGIPQIVGPMQSANLQFSVSDLPAGIYILKLSSGESQQISKVVIEN
jgi:hypothetical protein